MGDIAINSANSNPDNSVTKDIVNEIIRNADVIKTHRWSAAFPLVTEDLTSKLDSSAYEVDGKLNCFIDKHLHFAACGDYLSSNSQILGSVEGAVISGKQVAESIIPFL